MSNVTFNNCNFENCNILIGDQIGGSENSTESSNPLVGLALLGGLAMAFNPVLLGTVATISIIGAKGLAIGGLGYSTIKTLSILKDNAQQTKILETSNKQEWIETTYVVKELEEK